MGKITYMRHIYYIQYKWDIKCVQIQTYICEQIIDRKKEYNTSYCMSNKTNKKT